MEEAGREQDLAAGGRHHREIQHPDGLTSLASVELKRIRGGYSIYAYLRYTLGGRTISRYVGNVTSESRAAALRRAWRKARSSGLLRP